MTSLIRKLSDYGLGQISRARKSTDNFRLRVSSHARTYGPDFAHRRALANETTANTWSKFMPQETGAQRFDTGTLPGTDKVVAACRQIIDAREEEFLRLRDEAGKSYLVNVLDDDDFEAHPELVDFALSTEVVSAVTGYLGYVPRLGTINLLISMPGPMEKGSQWLHTDAGDPDNVKCFVNITDVAAHNGPLNVLPRPASQRFRRSIGNVSGFGKFSDAQVNPRVEPSEFLRNTGDAGSGMIADTSKCYHFGGRVETGLRGMLVVHYSRFSFGGSHLPTAPLRKRWNTNPLHHTLLTID
jgi:hypothetical protein